MTALCELEDVKRYMDIEIEEGETIDTDLLVNLIDQISASMAAYCGLDDFGLTYYQEEFDGDGQNTLFPNHYPITSVSGIFDDSDCDYGPETQISGSNYKIVDRNRIVMKNYGYFTSGVQNIRIGYFAGFATIPTDLKLVCIKEVARLFRTRIDKGAVSRSIQNNNTFTRYVLEEFLPENITVLNRYKIKGAL